MGKYALIIGNSQYDDHNLAKLIAPASDANAFAQLLKNPAIGGFDEVNILVDQYCKEIQIAINRLFSNKEPDDLVLFYFSGHGTKDANNRFYLAVRDTDQNLLGGTAIASTYIKEQINDSRSERQVLILDCCFSGSFAEGVKATGNRMGAGSTFGGKGRVVLTASDTLQYALDSGTVIGNAKNSVFTHFLIEGIQTGKADINSDGNITLNELFNYARTRVREVTPNQTPTKTVLREQEDIILVQNPNPIPVELEKSLKTKMKSSDYQVRKLAVEQLEELLHHENKGIVASAYLALEKLSEDDSRVVSFAAKQALDKENAIQSVKKVTGTEMASPAKQKTDQSLSAKRTQKISSGLSVTAGLVEIAAGWFGFLGVGYFLLNDKTGGWSRMGGWAITLIIMIIGSAITGGSGLTCAVPVWFIVPVISGLLLMSKKSGKD